MICLRNEVIFIFQNRHKMNDPKTHRPNAFDCSYRDGTVYKHWRRQNDNWGGGIFTYVRSA